MKYKQLSKLNFARANKMQLYNSKDNKFVPHTANNCKWSLVPPIPNGLTIDTTSNAQSRSTPEFIAPCGILDSKSIDAV